MLQLKNILIRDQTKNKIFKAYIYLGFIGIFFSIGENVKNINFYEDFYAINNLVALRSIIPFILLPINVILFLIIGKIKNINIIFNFFIFFIFIQFISLLINGFDLFLMQFLVGPLSLISLILLTKKNEDPEIIKNLILITFIIIIFILVIFIYQNPNLSYGGGNISIFNKNIIFINSNGLSRYLVLLYALLLAFFISAKFNYTKFFFISLLIGILVFKYEGRVNIGTFCILSLFIYFKNKKFIKNSLILIILFFLSAYISTSWETINKKNETNLTSILSFDFKSSPTNRYSADGKNYFTKQDLGEGITESMDNFLTGRGEKWKLLLSHKQNFNNIILGNGPEFDRYLLTESNKIDKKTTGTDSANSLIYVYLSGGLISLIMFVSLGINQLYKIFKIVKKKEFIHDKILVLSILCFVLIGIRAMFENSLSVWSIDLILFLLFGSIINSSRLNISKNTNN